MELRLNYTTKEILQMFVDAFEELDERNQDNGRDDDIRDENGEIFASCGEILDYINDTLVKADLWEFEIPVQLGFFEEDTRNAIVEFIYQKTFNLE